MSIQLIFNADDYGLTPEVSRGIRDAHLRGVVTSTTCMMNLPGTKEDIRHALNLTPSLGLGVHLNLTAGAPLLPPAQVFSLDSGAGNFLKRDILITQLETIRIPEVKAEWRAQIEAFISVAECLPTHLDSHQHTSYFTPALFRTMLELAIEYRCAIRLPVVDQIDFQVTGLPDEVTLGIQLKIAALVQEFAPRAPTGFLANFYDEAATEEEIFSYIAPLQNGTYEVMCHPGYNDIYLKAISSYAHQRQSELAVLTHPGLKQFLQHENIQLIHFGGV